MNWLIGGFTVMLVIAFGVISWAISVVDHAVVKRGPRAGKNIQGGDLTTTGTSADLAVIAVQIRNVNQEFEDGAFLGEVRYDALDDLLATIRKYGVVVDDAIIATHEATGQFVYSDGAAYFEVIVVDARP